MLKLPENIAARLRAHAERAYPEECCGVLLGSRTPATRSVVTAHACRNTHAGTRDRYAIAPVELVAVQRAAREQGLEIVGFYHSHPDHPPEPSSSDLTEAYWEGCSYVIVGVTSGKAGEIKSFELRRSHLEPEPVAPPAS